MLDKYIGNMHPYVVTLLDVLYTVFITPLTAGNVIQSDENNGSNTRKTDGSLSSMVTIACLTAITFVVIGIYAKSEDPGKSTIAITTMTFVLTAMALFAITTLIMHSTRVTIKETLDSVIAAEYVCLLLSVCNIVLWVGDSFNNMENSVTRLDAQDSNNSKTNKVMKYVIFPILVFYRFHASIDLFGLFSRMQKN
uniref:Uncharacterized protein n=1 Tax=Magallana gigas TaxID=29159 RepID=K1Q184_MAGGI